MANNDSELIDTYQRIFREQFCKRIAAYEALWTKAAEDKPETKWYFEVHLSKIAGLLISIES